MREGATLWILFVLLVMSLFFITAILYNILPENSYAQVDISNDLLKPLYTYSSSTLQTMTPTDKELANIVSYLEKILAELDNIRKNQCLGGVR